MAMRVTPLGVKPCPNCGQNISIVIVHWDSPYMGGLSHAIQADHATHGADEICEYQSKPFRQILPLFCGHGHQ